MYFYSHIFCKTLLIYYVHWIICFGTMMKLPIFISFKLLKLGCYIYGIRVVRPEDDLRVVGLSCLVCVGVRV